MKMKFFGFFFVGLIVCCSIHAVFSDSVVEEEDYANFKALCNETQKPVRQKKTYFVHNNKAVTFLEAWRQCQSVGHRLATISSEEDSRLLEQAIANSSNTSGPWYIAGTDLGNEGHYVWISTNKPVGHESGYLNYSPGQPDNAGGNEDCLEIGRWGGVVWNDVPCDWKQRYICEYVSDVSVYVTTVHKL